MRRIAASMALRRSSILAGVVQVLQVHLQPGLLQLADALLALLGLLREPRGTVGIDPAIHALHRDLRLVAHRGADRVQREAEGRTDGGGELAAQARARTPCG